MRICVYCASSSAAPRIYVEAARALGGALADRGHELVYGAGNIGLMGVLSRAARAGGARVTGVIPAFMNLKGLADPELSEIVVTDEMRSRKRAMEELADAFIACPGGLGTLEEILEILTLKQLGRLDKPCVILNTAGFYSHLIAQIDYAIDQRFIKSGYRQLFHVTDSPQEALDHIESYTEFESQDKWFEEAPTSEGPNGVKSN